MADNGHKTINFSATPDPLTPQEFDTLQAYIDAMKELEAVEPEYSPFNPATGSAWEEWNKKCVELNDKYWDIIVKAIMQSLRIDDTWEDSPQSVALILDALVMGNRPKEQSEGQISLFPEDEREQALKADILQALPRLQSIILQKHLIPNNKLANSITKDNVVDAGAIDLVVLGKGKNEITTRCILSYEGDNVKLSSRRPITEYARNVADAVASLYVYGDQSHIVTPAIVYRAMVHATETETPSPQQIGAVTKALDMLRFVRVQVDCTAELKKRKLNLNGEVISGGGIDTYLLALKQVWVISGGKKVSAYKIMEAPILYDYSRLTGQVLTVPAALLDIRDTTGAKIANTERRIAVKGYLMRRISVMKGKTGDRQSRHILYSAIFSEVCDTPPTAKEQRAIREYIDLVLESWKAQNFINGYTTITSGRKHTGVEISI